jgi:external thioesterase TEII
MNRLIQQFDSSSDKMPLICFPFAGGYSASFRPLHAYLKDHCHLLAIEPPGHGTNRMPLMENFEKLADMYVKELMPRLDKAFVLFGHSMGGLMVYRVAQKLEQRGIFPKAIIISAIQPPHVRRKAVTHMDDCALLDYMISIGGVPPELAKEREILEFFLPAFRADFKALETFEHTDHTLLQSPVHIFNGEQDAKCVRDAFSWKEWAHQLRFHTFQGGHMFLLSETEKVSRTIQFIVTRESVQKEVAKM